MDQFPIGSEKSKCRNSNSISTGSDVSVLRHGSYIRTTAFRKGNVGLKKERSFKGNEQDIASRLPRIVFLLYFLLHEP